MWKAFESWVQFYEFDIYRVRGTCPAKPQGLGYRSPTPERQTIAIQNAFLRPSKNHQTQPTLAACIASDNPHKHANSRRRPPNLIHQPQPHVTHLRRPTLSSPDPTSAPQNARPKLTQPAHARLYALFQPLRHPPPAALPHPAPTPRRDQNLPVLPARLPQPSCAVGARGGKASALRGAGRGDGEGGSVG